MDDSLGEAINEFLKPPFAMLLGHTTYNIFAGYWPKQDANNVAKPFNEATKYVVSHEPFEPGWVNTKVVSGDVRAPLRRLKAEDGPDMIVWGRRSRRCFERSSSTAVSVSSGGQKILSLT
jgi:dihydrofolate reductase